MINGKLTPLAEAVRLLGSKTAIGSILRSAEWENMPLALRQRAQFSAGVESMRLMQRIQHALTDAITLARNEFRKDGSGPGTGKMNRQKFIADIRQMALREGLTPDDPSLEGGLQDITSEARLDLIYRTQMGQAQGHAFWKRGQDKDVLDAWPAQELVRVSDRRVERGSDGRTESWPDKWLRMGGELKNGRMVALKTDPIWVRISRFDTPWPPFDFNSGMGLEEIDREEAVELGLIGPDEVQEPEIESFNESLEASVEGLDDQFKGALKTLFGDQIEINGDSVRWTGGKDEFANSNPAQPRDSLGRWVSEGGGSLSEKENIKRGTKAIRRAMAQRRDVQKAMHREGLGEVQFPWGSVGDKKNDYKGGFGVSHALAKHGRKDMLAMPVVIAKGKISSGQDPTKRLIEHQGYVAIVASSKAKNRQAWLLTGYKRQVDR